MSVSAGGQGSRERARGGQKTKATAHVTQSKATAPAAQSTGSPKSAAPASLTKDAKPATVTDPSKKSQDGKAAPRSGIPFPVLITCWSFFLYDSSSSRYFSVKSSKKSSVKRSEL